MMKVLFYTAGLSTCLIIAVALLLDRPPIFALNQAANHFSNKGDGLPRQLASLLIRCGIAQDWSELEEGALQVTRYPLLRSAANSHNTYPYQTYNSEGQPQGLKPGYFRPPPESRIVSVSTTQEIIKAIKQAIPGDIITITPGDYNFKARSIAVRAAGSANQPIYVRAEHFGTVRFDMDTLEGFHVQAPFWVFENLSIQGTCEKDSQCEHAFHVIGKGQSFTLRNSEVFNFNAPVKVNLQPIGGEDYYADYGLLEYDSFFNEHPRQTGNPVTLLNINTADGWVVRGNYIADFAKNSGNRVSYGAFMKGNGRGGIFERNLVICEHRLPADQGIRVGLSFGGGGTGQRYCKQGSCATEHIQGTMRNNIIMNCSRDVGIYLNRAYGSQIYHNLLYNNLGIDVRFESSSAQINNNIISGRIKNRDGGHSTAAGNIITRACVGSSRSGCELDQIYQAPERADFRLTGLDNPLWETVEGFSTVGEDICGHPLPEEANPGPIQYINGMDCLVASPPTSSD